MKTTLWQTLPVSTLWVLRTPFEMRWVQFRNGACQLLLLTIPLEPGLPYLHILKVYCSYEQGLSEFYWKISFILFSCTLLTGQFCQMCVSGAGSYQEMQVRRHLCAHGHWWQCEHRTLYRLEMWNHHSRWRRACAGGQRIQSPHSKFCRRGEHLFLVIGFCYQCFFPHFLSESIFN